MITPDIKTVTYGVDFKRVMKGRLNLSIGDGWVKADDNLVFVAKDLRVGGLQGFPKRLSSPIRTCSEPGKPWQRGKNSCVTFTMPLFRLIEH